MKLSEVAKKIGGEVSGDPNLDIQDIASLNDAKSGDLAFVLEKKFLKDIKQTGASALITYCHCDFPHYILVSEPRKSLAHTIQLFKEALINEQKRPIFSAAKAPIHSSANIYDKVDIAPFTVIGENSCVDQDTTIGSHVSIGRHCKIGKSCIIYPGVTLYDYTEIGDCVIIHSGAVIGSDGFGYYQEDQKWHKIPHTGKVVIESDVEIGASCAIDRGCLGETRIGKGTKLDNLVHIAHNSIIGNHCAITAQVGCTGGTIIQDAVQIGGQTGIDAATIGKNAIVAARSGVTRDIPENTLVSGFPAWDHKKELKKEALVRKLARKSIK